MYSSSLNMHSHYGVGTSTEPIVISDDEEEAAFVEFTLEQRISSPSNSEDHEDSRRSGWPQGEPIYVEDEPAQALETGNGLPTSDFGIEHDIDRKRKRSKSVDSVDNVPLRNRPVPRGVSPNAPPGETKQARKRRRKREKQATEAAKSHGLAMSAFSPMKQLESSQLPNQTPLKPKFPLPPKPITAYPPPKARSPPQTLSPSTYKPTHATPSLSSLPSHPSGPTWPQVSHTSQPPPPSEPPPELSIPVHLSAPSISKRPLYDFAKVKKTIGRPPDPDSHSQHGLYFLPPHSKWKPNPARSLVLELIPKRFRMVSFILEWAETIYPAGPPPRVELDQKTGKALVEFPSADIARSAWDSPRLYGGGQEQIKAYWYRLPGVGADAGVGELEEGEIEDGELTKSVVVKGNAPKPKRNKKNKNIPSLPSSSMTSATFSMPPPSVPPSPSPTPSIASTVTFSEGKWRSTSLVRAEEPPPIPSLPPGACWVYQDGRPVIQYRRSERPQEPEHLPPPISLSAFIDPQEDILQSGGSLQGIFDKHDPNYSLGGGRTFQDARAARPELLNLDHLPSPISLSAFVSPQEHVSHSGFPHFEQGASTSRRSTSLPSEETESMDIAAENGGIFSAHYPPILEVGPSYAIGPPEAYPGLSPEAYISMLTGTNNNYPEELTMDPDYEEPADSDYGRACMDSLFPDEPQPRLVVHAPSPRPPVKPANHSCTGVTDVSTTIRSASPSPTSSTSGTFTNSLNPKTVTSASSSTTPTPPVVPEAKETTEMRKQKLLAREKELQETIAKMTANKNGSRTSVVAVKEQEALPSKATLVPTAAPTPSETRPELQCTAEARNMVKEDQLRQLVLNSKRTRAKNGQPSASDPEPSAAQEAKSIVVAAESTVKVTATSATTNFEDLAVSFIAETIQTASAPALSGVSAPSAPLSTSTVAVTGADTPSVSVSQLTSTVLESAPKSSGTLPPAVPTMTEKQRLAAKQKLLEQKISESKTFMAQYAAATTKVLKTEVMKNMEERLRALDEEMKALDKIKPQVQINTNVRLSANGNDYNSTTPISRSSTPGFMNGSVFGQSSARRSWWPESRLEKMVIDISDEESGEDE